MRYRALALDLDGTLMTPGETISLRTTEVLARARVAGLRLIVATARWHAFAERMAREIGSREPVMACSGAQVRRQADEHDLLDLRLPPDFAAELAKICDEERCVASFVLDDLVATKSDSPFPGPPEVFHVERLSGRNDPPPRVALVQGTPAIERIVAELRQGWSDRVRFGEAISSRGKRLLTLTAAGVDKGAALAVACADIGISTDEVAAFGDAEVDVEMFRVAGMSVAMGQSSDDVKAAATWVTASNKEDGVARAVERLLAER